MAVNPDPNEMQFPVIDLSGLDGPRHNEVVEELVKAAKGFGFFQLVNHGMTVEFLDELQESARYFFNQQQVEKKMVFHEGESPSPSVTYGETFAPEEKKYFVWVATPYMEEDNEDALTHWPESFKEVILKYIKTSTVLAKRILHFLMNNIGVKLDNSETKTYMGAKTITVNFYPPCTEPDRTIGLGRHSDFGTITILLQDDVGGLFVKLENDIDAEQDATWVEIKPIPGALLIFVGDSLEILSSGEYKSAEHWVRTSNTKSRISFPVFFGPILTTKIRPLPDVAEKDGGSRYKEIVFGEYVGNAYTLPARGKTILNAVKITHSS